MSLITRRKFTGLLGLVAADGILKSAGAQSHGPEHVAPAKPMAAPPAPAPKAVPRPVTAKHSAPLPVVDRATAAPEEIWQDLIEGNKRFVSGKTLPRDVVSGRAKSARAQHPFVIVLCCSDSRLSPELIFDQGIGDLFVVRTAGNIADPIALGSMEYAIEHLGSRMLVVLGHEKCGAVSATLSGDKMPTENLAALVEKIKPGIERLQGLVQGETLMNLAVEANVHHSTSDVVEGSPIVQHELASAGLTVVKAVYRLGTGEVIRLSGGIGDVGNEAKH